MQDLHFEKNDSLSTWGIEEGQVRGTGSGYCDARGFGSELGQCHGPGEPQLLLRFI